MSTQVDNKILHQTAESLGKALQSRQLMLCTAESCTGGWVGKVLTEVHGSSKWYDRGFVTYSNHAKHEMLGIPMTVIEKHGAVSEKIAFEMVEGALSHSWSDCALAITGIAGPGGGTENKPVGTVWFAWGINCKDLQRENIRKVEVMQFEGEREQVRAQAVLHAIKTLSSIVDNLPQRTAIA